MVSLEGELTNFSVWMMSRTLMISRLRVKACGFSNDGRMIVMVISVPAAPRMRCTASMIFISLVNWSSIFRI